MNAKNLKLNGCSGVICQRGFTLVELMIAMTVGLFLSAGVIALFLGTKQSYRLNEGMAIVQENGRFAIEYLSREIREAGFRAFNTLSTTPVQGDIQNWIDEWATVDQGEDDWLIKSKFIDDWPISGLQGSSSNPLPSVVTTYRAETDIFKIQFIYYDSSADEFELKQVLYSIAPSSASGRPGLRQRIYTQRLTLGPPIVLQSPITQNEELMEGVYDMQVRYRLDGGYVNADSSEFINASGDQIVAVRLDLLLGSSEDNLVDAPMSLPFENNDGSSPFTATDRRFYQTFITTIALRNNLP